MGAIVGILAKSVAADEALATQMLAVAPHRGPDYIVRIHGTCILGVSNKRESVDSTMSALGNLTAVFSGVLDNDKELIAITCEAGHEPVSADPADIVVATFRAFGADAPRRMRGTFAGLVTDGREMWCFRDQLGFKPLFYHENHKAFFAATEAKQVIAGAKLQRNPDLDVLTKMFYGWISDEDRSCPLKGVNRLPKASIIWVSYHQESRRYRYWRPETLLETARLSAPEVKERFTQLFQQAVDRSLTSSDVVALSGGIDSPAVAAFAAYPYLEKTGQHLSALSAVFPQLPAVDESRYIRLVAEHLGLDLHTYTIKCGSLDNLQEWCRLLDAPVPTISLPQINEYYALTRKLGLRNILNGDIAEFLFCFHRHTMGHLLTHGRWLVLTRLIAQERRRGIAWRDIAHQLGIALTPGRLANWYYQVRGLDHPERIPDWLDSRIANEVPYWSDLLPPTRRRWSSLQLVALSGSTITMDAAECCAEVNGVTVRRPFGDVDLWEFFLSLRAETKFPDLGFKSLARDLLRGKVPETILQRRDKTVFDDHVMSQINYPVMRQFLIRPISRIRGVDYERLATRIEREDFTLIDRAWANDLVRIHAFLNNGNCET